jgi:hypothetical protein
MNRVVIQSQKEMVREDLLVYFFISGIDVAYDWIVNIGINQKHPFSIGVWQGLIFLFCLVQIARKVKQYKWLA